MDFEQAESLNGSIRLLAIKHRAMAAAALRSLGLHPGHEAVLLALDSHGPRTQAQLAEEAGCAPPSITGMVQKLQAGGLVDRRPAPGNARATIVELTDDGRAMIPDLKSLWVQLAADTMATVPDMDLAQLTTTLNALASGLQQGH